MDSVALGRFRRMADWSSLKNPLCYLFFSMFRVLWTLDDPPTCVLLCNGVSVAYSLKRRRVFLQSLVSPLAFVTVELTPNLLINIGVDLIFNDGCLEDVVLTILPAKEFCTVGFLLLRSDARTTTSRTWLTKFSLFFSISSSGSVDLSILMESRLWFLNGRKGRLVLWFISRYVLSIYSIFRLFN